MASTSGASEGLQDVNHCVRVIAGNLGCTRTTEGQGMVVQEHAQSFAYVYPSSVMFMRGNPP